MFEDALMESGGRVRTGNRWTATVSFTVQAAILVALVLYARFGPHPLLVTAIDMNLAAPAIAPAPHPLPQLVRIERTPSGAASQSTIQFPVNVPRRIDSAEGNAPPVAMIGEMAKLGSGTAERAGNGDGSGAAPIEVVKAYSPSRVRISAGVVQANCISCPQPAYPAVARAVHESGTVVLDAVISKAGTIENLQVVSGPQLLQKAAMDAVRNWRYKPTVLSGQPVEVQAEINVVFKLQ